MTASGTSRPALRIGTRGSQLALWQAHAVRDRLGELGTPSEIVVIRTTGDRSQTRPVPGDDTKRQFVKEIEDAILSREVDIAVHSAKDMTVDLPPGLDIAACLPRADPHDVLVLAGANGLIEWPQAIDRLSSLGRPAVIGTSSVRRSAQLRRVLDTATFAPIRGNVDTRLQKLDAGGFDAIVLARAGLCRLGFESRVSAIIPIEACVPAPGQGIVAVEIRTDDDVAREALRRLHDDDAGCALAAERAVVEAVGGGCDLPLGALAIRAGDVLQMRGLVAARDGSRAIAKTADGSPRDPAAVGRRLAQALVADGALELLNA